MSILSLIIAALGFTLDQKTKAYIDRSFTQGRKVSLWGGRIVLSRALNSGFAMNKMENRRSLVVKISAVVFVLFAGFYGYTLVHPDMRAFRLAMGLLAAGAAGNFYDRYKKGYVVDFISLKGLKGVIFNLADIFIVTGMLWTVFLDLLAA